MIRSRIAQNGHTVNPKMSQLNNAVFTIVYTPKYPFLLTQCDNYAHLQAPVSSDFA